MTDALPAEADHHIRRSGDDYAEAWAALLPRGAAWPRDPDSVLMRLISGQAQIWGDPVDTRAADLLETEADPRFTLELLEDWERAYGLPDPCVPVVQTLPERRQALVDKIKRQGGQSRAFFLGIAASLGYEIVISESDAFQFGLSSFGGSHGRFNPPGMRYVWTVRVTGARLTRFQFGQSSFGRDPFLDIRRAEDLECIFQRLKPAHTLLFFAYGPAPTPRVQHRFNFGGSAFGRDPFLRLASA